MRKQIDIQKVLSRTGLTYKSLAEELFPNNAYPHLSLRRVEKKKTFLDEPQIMKIALLADLTISELFGESDWKSFSKEGVIYFMSKDYKAELNKGTNSVKVFHKNTLFHEEVLFEGCIKLSDFIDKLDNLISNQSK